MLEQLRKLAQVQIVDKTLFGLSQEREVIPQRLSELDEEEKALAGELATLDAELEASAGRKAELEKTNSQISSRLRKAESRLMGAKSQKEYKAANAELEDNREMLKENEELLLQVMESHEAFTKKQEELAAKLAEFKTTAGEERDTLNKRSQDVEKQYKRLNTKRESLVEGVDGSLLGQYDFIRKRSRGVALAGVKDGSCMACHVDIPPQQYMELQRMDQIMNCPSCSRLIYWADAEDFEIE